MLSGLELSCDTCVDWLFVGSLATSLYGSFRKLSLVCWERYVLVRVHLGYCSNFYAEFQESYLSFIQKIDLPGLF